MVDEIAGWQAKQPDGVRYGRSAALRQTLEAAVRWGHMSSNPAKLAGRNRQPAQRTVRAFTRDEIEIIAAELSPMYASLPAFAAATGFARRNGRRSSAATSTARPACSMFAAPSHPATWFSSVRQPAAVDRCRCRLALSPRSTHSRHG